MNFYSVKNEDKNYSMSVEADNVKLVGTDKIKVIYNSSSIQIIGTRFDNMLNGELKKIVCGDKYVAVYLKNENGTHSLRAFNSSGTQCWQRDFSTTCITDFGFESSVSPVLWMSELSTVGNSFSTSISLYDLSRESVIGIISVQQQIVKNVFITKKSIFAFCTDYLTGPKFAIDAIAAGKEAAISLHRFVHPGQTLTAGRDRRVYKALDKEHVLIETADFDKDHRQMPGYNAAKAKTFSDARVTFTEEQVRRECARCLGCGATKVDSYLCIGCGLCTTKCKFDAIHLKKVRDWHAGSYETMPIKVAEGVVKRAGSIVKKAVSK